MPLDLNLVKQQTLDWLQDVVVGLNLCPFAAKPLRNDCIRIEISLANTEQVLLEDLHREIEYLDSQSSEQLETSLLVVPKLFESFSEYNQFLDLADELIRQFAWEGQYQLASFHPGYCFAGTNPDDLENLTNRSPYPILHIIREQSIEKALENHPDPELIPQQNIQKMKSLTEAQVRQLFYYLFS